MHLLDKTIIQKKGRARIDNIQFKWIRLLSEKRSSEIDTWLEDIVQPLANN